MALGAVLAAALTDHSARYAGLFVAGVDVLKQPSATGNGYGVLLDTIEVNEQGSGGVSSMTFTIEDPSFTVQAPRTGDEVRYQILANATPEFLGFVQSIRTVPAFGDQGRMIVVTAQGVESLLDWAVTASDMTLDPNVLGTIALIQSIVANSVGLGPVRAFTDPTGAIAFGNQALPIGINFGPAFGNAITIPAGTTVRQAFQQFWATFGGSSITSLGEDRSVMYITIDFTWGLRMFPDYAANPPGPALPADYTNLTVTDTSVGAIVAEGLSYATDSGGIVRGVVVKGTGVTATVTDGSGKLGPFRTLEDTTITTVAAATAAGASYLATFQQTIRGDFDLLDHSPVTTIHTGSFVLITDARAELAGEYRRIMAIRKRYHGTGRQDWTVSFGGLPPSGAALMRRLTRDQLS